MRYSSTSCSLILKLLPQAKLIDLVNSEHWNCVGFPSCRAVKACWTSILWMRPKWFTMYSSSKPQPLIRNFLRMRSGKVHSGNKWNHWSTHVNQAVSCRKPFKVDAGQSLEQSPTTHAAISLQTHRSERRNAGHKKVLMFNFMDFVDFMDFMVPRHLRFGTAPAHWHSLLTACLVFSKRLASPGTQHGKPPPQNTLPRSPSPNTNDFCELRKNFRDFPNGSVALRSKRTTGVTQRKRRGDEATTCCSAALGGGTPGVVPKAAGTDSGTTDPTAGADDFSYRTAIWSLWGLWGYDILWTNWTNDHNVISLDVWTLRSSWSFVQH